MTTRIAINGFGRIGRAALRIVHERRKAGVTDLEIVAINDLTDVKTLTHLLKYDSVHRRFGADVSHDDGHILVDGRSIRVSSERDPAKLPWKEAEIDVVFEATGVFRSREKAAAHIDAGAKKVVMSAPGKGTPPDATICAGVNDADYKPAMQVVSTASCTTNCLVPVAKVIDDSFGLEHALLTTVHSYTNDQRILDLPHSDLRRARAAAMSMIPTTTGAAAAVALVLPKLAGKLDGMAIRVPTPDVSLIDVVFNTTKDASADDVNAALLAASEGEFKGILGYSDEPLVSCDYLGTSESSIVDALSTKGIGGRMVKVLSWYDNEWGFTNRAVDLLELVGTGG